MVGYLSPRHADFGYASAKLDDLANWIPARLTAFCLWLAAWAVPGARMRGALAATWREAPRHPSPNAGWPEAMMARLLGVPGRHGRLPARRRGFAWEMRMGHGC